MSNIPLNYKAYGKVGAQLAETKDPKIILKLKLMQDNLRLFLSSIVILRL